MPSHLRATIIFFTIILLLLIISGIIILLFPSARTGPFGIGLPASMDRFVSEFAGISIDYPSSWVAFEMPQGDHGDSEILATINVPGRSFPQVMIAAHIFLTDGDLQQVAEWGYRKKNEKERLSELGLTNFSTPEDTGLARDYSWYSNTFFGRISIRCRDYYLLHETAGYMLTFCSEADNWAEVSKVFQNMMNSFSLE